MKILLLNPPGDKLYLRDQHCSSTSKANYYWPPVDLIMISGILSNKHEISVIDAIVENIKERECLERISSVNPDFIIFMTGISSWLEDFQFVEKAKHITNSKLIASGGFLRYDYIHVMKRFTFLDAIVMDYTSSSILDYIDGEKDAINDMCLRIDNKIVLMPPSNKKEFEVPIPLHELFPLYKYRLPHNRYSPFTSVLTNYGCPYQCNFCVAAKIDFKYRPVDNIIPELQKLMKMGVKEIFFKDFTFGIPKNISVQLCKEIIEKLPGLSWICSSRVNLLDEDMLRLMKRAGCHTIQFGVETAAQELLDSNNKMTNIEQIKQTFSLCRKLKIRTLAHFILGLPGETEDSVKETIKLAKEIKCDYGSFNIAIPIYGTVLRQQCIENKWINEETVEFDSSNGFPVIETPHLSKKKLWKLRNYALFSFYLRPSYILNKLINIRSSGELLSLFKEGLSLIGSIKLW